MKLLLIFLAVTAAAAADKNPTKNEQSVELNLISNEALMKNVVACFLEKAKCTPETSHLKELFAKMQHTRCASCSAEMKERIKTVSKHLIVNQPDLWKQLTNKYDPERKHEKAVRDFLNL